MSFTVKIIDNDNGSIIVDESEAKGILGAVGTEKGVQAIYSTACDAMECAGIVYGAKSVANAAIKKNPNVAMIVAFVEANADKFEKIEIDLSEIKKAQNGDTD